MTVAFALHAALGRAMKLAINLGSQFVQRLLVTRTPRLKQFGDFISSGSIQLKPLDLGGKESSFSLNPEISTACGCLPEWQSRNFLSRKLRLFGSLFANRG